MPNSAAIQWLFADRRTGRLVIGQQPNALMWLALGATAGRLAARGSHATSTFRAVQGVALGLWALDEAVRGVNPFRRTGGCLVLAGLMARSRL